MSQNNQNKLNIKATDEALKGHYANMMQVSNGKEEFILDFFMAHPPAGQLIDRIVVSPGHAKRIAAVLQNHIKKYEDQHGTIEEAKAPEAGNIGFQNE